VVNVFEVHRLDFADACLGRQRRVLGSRSCHSIGSMPHHADAVDGPGATRWTAVDGGPPSRWAATECQTGMRNSRSTQRTPDSAHLHIARHTS
jgi:hypothetical protein